MVTSFNTTKVKETEFLLHQELGDRGNGGPSRFTALDSTHYVLDNLANDGNSLTNQMQQAACVGACDSESNELMSGTFP